MDLNQRRTKHTQHLGRNRAIIHKCPLAPVRHVEPPQNKLAFKREAGLLQNPGHRVPHIQLELGDHLALHRPLAHHFSPATPPKHKAQTIKQYRFSCAGFSGQHIKTRTKVQVYLLDEQHVFYGKVHQHWLHFSLSHEVGKPVLPPARN